MFTRIVEIVAKAGKSRELVNAAGPFSSPKPNQIASSH